MSLEMGRAVRYIEFITTINNTDINSFGQLKDTYFYNIIIVDYFILQGLSTINYKIIVWILRS